MEVFRKAGSTFRILRGRSGVRSQFVCLRPNNHSARLFVRSEVRRTTLNRATGVVVDGEPCRFLVFGHLVLGERELDHAGRIEIDARRKRFAFRPDPDSLWGQRYPQAVYHLVTSTPDALDAIGGDELLYGDEFRAFADRHPDHFRFVPCFSRVLPDNPHADVRHGYVQQFLGEFAPDPTTDIAYLCGNPNMVDACFEALKDCGLEVKQIRREKYVSSK